MLCMILLLLVKWFSIIIAFCPDDGDWNYHSQCQKFWRMKPSQNCRKNNFHIYIFTKALHVVLLRQIRNPNDIFTKLSLLKKFTKVCPSKFSGYVASYSAATSPFEFKQLLRISQVNKQSKKNSWKIPFCYLTPYTQPSLQLKFCISMYFKSLNLHSNFESLVRFGKSWI